MASENEARNPAAQKPVSPENSAETIDSPLEQHRKGMGEFLKGGEPTPGVQQIIQKGLIPDIPAEW